MVRQTQVLSHFPFAISSERNCLFPSPFAADKQHRAWPWLLACAAIVCAVNEECSACAQGLVVSPRSQF